MQHSPLHAVILVVPRHVGGGLGLLSFDRFFDFFSLRAGRLRIRAASSSGICSTDRSVRSIARLRTPVCSIVRLALLSWQLDFLQDAAEFVELSPHGSENAPHLRGALLDGQGLEAHAQAGEDRD